ncbi:hypothetical protein ABB37_06345 [Leptomonas pyrrhocoris]|uniref:Uncharacterized protein n=1 Tax=Leptomonas pyrrhocoris TaxID=157538 RepID=A0A0M9FXU0_LEPPY|nr:hypothetical protein ABB37_06345 [Leptomonas pyrrhocoris]XP_015656613.1 hypothetical protein ABB37_06345 [Leptomonas pyrrhocoris]XP_015656614.1 hypothetical protein ABB37_06345 [Leptomonas pyrrhocoris]KPA78173.1 hypothetical protein ABB37_06345 [Leptomonas pyrrhocoris]KPA78174.1 hypothetical protein ABB37_06345 [Leptomonas pyrrhocoris]KPA78175.1 hypothetical protein ABB37_06345 [Leptomonas pyrrhocoris]|eukprot:XP_015656612.1 hypothetical protein ABB37_06345 [Leptomonas pyrrhocoris]
MSSTAESAAARPLSATLGNSDSMDAAGTTSIAAAPPATPPADYVNYMDIKLEGVHHLPADWLSAGLSSCSIAGGSVQANVPASAAHLPGKEEDEAEVAYAYHPFRYEVTLSLPADATNSETAAAVTNAAGAPHTQDGAAAGTAEGDSGVPAAAVFTRGRVLQPLPAYAAYIANAEAPPVSGQDDAAPLRDVPAAIDAEAVRHSADSAKEGAEEKVNEDAAPASAPEDAAPPPPPQQPAILWVVTDRTDGAEANTNSSSFTGGSGSSGLLAAKRRMKLSGGAGAGASAGSGRSGTASALAAAAAANTAAAQAAAAAVPGAPPPPLPDVSEPPPCVVRVPLTAAQEAHLDTLLNAGKPLELRFRRTLRAGCPVEWEDLNAAYYEAVIPVSLQSLSMPGSTHLSAEVPLQPAHLYCMGGAESIVSGMTGGAAVLSDSGAAAASAAEQDKGSKKRTVPRKVRQTVPGLLVDEPDRSAPHPYTLAGTSASLKLTFQRTLTPLVSDRIRPAATPAQLIPSRPTPTLAAATAADVRTRLQCTLRDIAQQLLRDVREVAHETALSNASKSAKGSVDSAAWRAQFVAALQSTGQLAAFKSHLTPLVTELVQERLRVHPTACPEEVARASNELYVQLMDMLHATLCEAVEGGDASSNGESSHRDAVKATTAEEETRDAELRWRALEAEVSGEVGLAGTLYHSRLATHSGDAASWAALWIDCGLHYQRVEELAKAEQCYREAIACDVACVPALLDYGAWLLANDRLDEASVFLHGLVDVAPQHALGWGCVALLADLRELAVRVGSADAAAEQAKWRREHNLAVRRAVECMEQELKENGSAASTSTFSEEQVYLNVAAYLVQLHHRDLANVCLARCRPGEPRVELLYAELFTQGGQCDEALKALDEVEKSTSTTDVREAADTCVLLRAECVFALGQTAEAVALYKQALAHGNPATAPGYLPQVAARWRDDAAARRTTSATSATELAEARRVEATCVQRLRAYLCLCNALLAEGRYKDALGATTLALQVWPCCSLLWLGAGIAYYRTGDLTAAEECLQESNTLNPMNARTWVYLTLLSVRLQHVGVEEMVEQVMGLSLDDAALWAELGRTLLNTASYPKLSIVCLRRAAALARAQLRKEKENSTPAAAAAASLLPSTQYHLAHALMDTQQWEEAEQLLTVVAAEGGGNEVLRGKAEEELSMLRAA